MLQQSLNLELPLQKKVQIAAANGGKYLMAMVVSELQTDVIKYVFPLFYL